jgi:hypothetical protein
MLDPGVFLNPAGTACDRGREPELVSLAIVFGDLLAAGVRKLRIQMPVQIDSSVHPGTGG